VAGFLVAIAHGSESTRAGAVGCWYYISQLVRGDVFGCVDEFCDGERTRHTNMIITCILDVTWN
jgi:hypothetical protein